MSWPPWLTSSSLQPSPESGGHVQASLPSATACASNPAPGGLGSLAHHDVVRHQESATTTATTTSAARSECDSSHSSPRPKRKRDEEPAAVARSSSAPSVQSVSCARGVPNIDSMMDVDDGVGTDDEPASKKSREAAPERESHTPQSYTRGKFRITRHDAVPGEQKRPLFSTGKRALASDAGDRRGSSGMRKDNRSLPRGERQPGRVSRRFSTPANTSMYSRSFGGGEFPQLSASRFSSPGAGSSSTPTQGSRFYFGRGAAVFPAADDNAEDGSSSSSSSAVSRGCPPLVVIDGSNAAFAYREGDRRWHAEGPLLAIQYFEDRGVEAVAFIPRQRLDGVSPQDDVYPAFQEARASGAISLVPAGGNDDIYFLKYAIDRNAPVVSNDRFRDHAANGETLAALGRTRTELMDYLSEHQVGYTFARDEFVPNPEAQAIKELTRHASDKRVHPPHETTGATSRHTSEPLPRRREDEHDS